jgi:hypothetical protein
VEPPRVGRLLTDGVRFSVRIVLIPRHILRLAMPRRRASRPAGVFPLGVRRQAIFPVVSEHSGFAVELGELQTVLTGLVPGHRIHRCIANLLMDRRICACDRCILSLRDRRFPQIEVAGERDFALLFPSPMALLGLRAPHGERPGRNANHHAAGGGLEFRS